MQSTQQKIDEIHDIIMNIEEMYKKDMPNRLGQYYILIEQMKQWDRPFIERKKEFLKNLRMDLTAVRRNGDALLEHLNEEIEDLIKLNETNNNKKSSLLIMDIESTIQKLLKSQTTEVGKMIEKFNERDLGITISEVEVNDHAFNIEFKIQR